MRTQLALSITLVLLSLPGYVPQKPSLEGAVAFDEGWSLEGRGTRIEREGGLDVLKVETGFAHRRDLRLIDGTIDVDVRLTRRRSFVYIHFRAQGDGEREEFYLRPHKSMLPDAVQYAPVWQNRSAWQLHHGPGGTAAVPFDTSRWTHVRIVLRGRSAALFVDDLKTPALLVPRLSRDPQPGYISLGGFLPADVPGEGPIATFANLQVRPQAFPFDVAAAAVAAQSNTPPTGTAQVVTAWAISQAYVPSESAETSLPPHAVTGAFRTIAAEPDGLVQLHRSVKVPDGSRISAAVARIRLTATSAQVVPFDLGFSDIATAFVNGVPVFRGDASYSFDRPRREGLIGFDQARLFLPLKAGENDLSIVLSDSFGGWGLMGRFPGQPSITMDAR